MTVRNRAIKVDQRTTTVALDDVFWQAISKIASARGEAADVLASRIAETAGTGRIAAGLRVFVVETLARESQDR